MSPGQDLWGNIIFLKVRKLYHSEFCCQYKTEESRIFYLSRIGNAFTNFPGDYRQNVCGFSNLGELYLFKNAVEIIQRKIMNFEPAFLHIFSRINLNLGPKMLGKTMLKIDNLRL